MRKAARIIRAPHDNRNPFKIVRRATFEDSELSFEARGVMAYLLMKPDDWSVEIPDLMREGKMGRDKTYRILNELIERGYVERIDQRDQGKFGGASYLLYESPQARPSAPAQPLPENPDTVPLPEKPYPEKPYPEKPYPENPDHTNKGYSTKEGKNTKEGGGEGANAPPHALPPSVDADVEFVDGMAVTPGQGIYAAICEVMGWDRKTLTEKRKRDVAETATILMAAGYSSSDVRRFMPDVWFRDWRWQEKGSHPTLGQLREEIGKLRVKLPEPVPRAAPTSRVAGSLAAIDEYERIKAKHRNGDNPP